MSIAPPRAPTLVKVPLTEALVTVAVLETNTWVLSTIDVTTLGQFVRPAAISFWPTTIPLVLLTSTLLEPRVVLTVVVTVGE